MRSMHLSGGQLAMVGHRCYKAVDRSSMCTQWLESSTMTEVVPSLCMRMLRQPVSDDRAAHAALPHRHSESSGDPHMHAALWSLLPAVKFSLEATNGFPAAANFPRAHYPFPERGRCSLGIEVPLHPSVSRAARSGGASWALKDCWSLGEEVPPGRRPPCTPLLPPRCFLQSPIVACRPPRKPRTRPGSVFFGVLIRAGMFVGDVQ